MQNRYKTMWAYWPTFFMTLKRWIKNAWMNNKIFYFIHFNLKFSSETIIRRIFYTLQYIFSYQHKLPKNYQVPVSSYYSEH